MQLDDDIRERVTLLAGKATGVDCPNCGYQSRDVDLEAHRMEDVVCPDCGETVLSADEKAQLRRAGKL